MNIMFFLKPKSELAYIYDYHTLRQAMEIMEYHKYSCVPIHGDLQLLQAFEDGFID